MVTDTRAADLVYANDSGSFAQIIDAKVRGELHPNAKIIFTQLDLAPHLGNAFPLARIKEQLSHADAVTTISGTVQRDIRERLGIEATVVYNPIRDVFRHRVATDNPIRGLFVGRVNDPSKRAALGAAALAILGYGWDDIVTVGREPPHYGGRYAGPTPDAELNRYYNSADYLICPTQHAFLGLPILEAMACGTIPVVCRDLDIKSEFLPSSVFPEYDEVEPTAPSIARFLSRFMGEDGAERKAEFSQRVHNHYLREWSSHLSPVGVARAILNVYQTL